MCVAEISFDDMWQLGLVFAITFMLQFFPSIGCSWHRMYFSHKGFFFSDHARARDIISSEF